MNDINNLLELNVEMEGLLRVLAQRENPHAAEALARKAAEYHAKVEAYLDVAVRPTTLKEEEAVAPEMEDSFEAVESGPFTEVEEVRPVSRDLSKALSLNDRFRFAGELFEGNTQAYQNAISHIATLGSFAEVIEYLSSGLGLNLSDPTAKEFADRLMTAFGVKS